MTKHSLESSEARLRAENVVCDALRGNKTAAVITRSDQFRMWRLCGMVEPVIDELRLLLEARRIPEDEIINEIRYDCHGKERPTAKMLRERSRQGTTQITFLQPA